MSNINLPTIVRDKNGNPIIFSTNDIINKKKTVTITYECSNNFDIQNIINYNHNILNFKDRYNKIIKFLKIFTLITMIYTYFNMISIYNFLLIFYLLYLYIYLASIINNTFPILKITS